MHDANLPIGITLPLPGAGLHAHAKGHWRPKASATRDARSLACATARSKASHRKRNSGRKQIDYLFFLPDLRRRDEANLVQSCKAYIDGLVDAGVIERDDWVYLHTRSIEVEVDRSNPRVELVISDWEV